MPLTIFWIFRNKHQRVMSNWTITFLSTHYEKFKTDFVKQAFSSNFQYYFDGAMSCFCFFMLSSFLIYYILSPKLIQFEVNNTNHHLTCTKRLRIKWSHTILSLINALYSIIASSYLLYFDIGFLKNEYRNRLLGFTNVHGFLYCFGFGYFLWDLFCVIYNYNVFEPLFLPHAFMCVVTSINSFV